MALAELDTSKVRARPGSRITDKQAQEIAPHLSALEQSGNLRPEAVVELARDPGNPLHAHFEWDDAVAAHQRRLDVARTLIRSISYRVLTIGKDLASFTAAFVSVRESEAEADAPTQTDRRYADVTRVLSDEELRKQMLAGARRDLEAWVRKYETLAALANAMGPARALLEQVRAA